MPRPCKCRRIRCKPDKTYFKPRGIPVDELEEVILTLDEFEAIRLADLKGLKQTDAAKRLKISRPTFSRIVASARGKIAGHALADDGGQQHQSGHQPEKGRIDQTNFGVQPGVNKEHR